MDDRLRVRLPGASSRPGWRPTTRAATASGSRFAKKGTGCPRCDLAEALDVALCFGWIDGQRKASRRHALPAEVHAAAGAQSKWSKINVGEGRGADRGGADAARGPRRDRAREGRRPLGRRLRLTDATSQVPPDLQAELDKDPAAAAFFAALDSQNRYAILYRLHDAKRPETRARRLAQFVDMLKRGETASLTTSKSLPRSRLSARRSSLSQRESGAPEMNQSEPLSATSIP